MRLRDELQSELGVAAEIRPGWPTQFKVLADQEVIFSRRKEKRLPLPGELKERLRQRFTA